MVNKCFEPEEIFVNDGAQTILTNILDLFGSGLTVAIQSPYYPSAYESLLVNGVKKIIELKGSEDIGFRPPIPKEKVDLIFLCSPNNPSGTAINRSQLSAFVHYALENNALIIIDSVYTFFRRDNSIPLSIYEIEGAEQCAIEIGSFSKFANLAGIRIGWNVIPNNLLNNIFSHGELRYLWTIRNSIKFWGASSLSQEAAMSILEEESKSCMFT